MTHRLLEIGPGDKPLVNPSHLDSDWAAYLNVGIYTAVQPPLHRGIYAFPDECRGLPRVNIIEAPIESAGLEDNTFDEVFAANVIGDPGVNVWNILHHAARVVKPGGPISFLDTLTPENALKVHNLEKFYEGKCLLIRHVNNYMNSEGGYVTNPTPEWIAAVEPYSAQVRKAARSAGVHTLKGVFTQFVKL